MHSRPLELICVDDKMRICTQCALFGDHKGHEVRLEEDIRQEIAIKVEVIMEMYKAMETSSNELASKAVYSQYYNNYRGK
jgi:hypothetical protein